MKVDSGDCHQVLKVKSNRIFFTCGDEITSGSWLKTRSDDWHQVLKVKSEGYVQSTVVGLSIQSVNYAKAKQTVYMFDGEFLQKRDISEVYKMYIEMYKPNQTNVVLQLLEYKFF